MTEEKKTLAYQQIGDKESELTLVFIHGSTMTKGGMLPVAEGFTKYNCIIFDLTAHGDSAGEEPYEVKTFAEHVEASVAQLQQDKVVGEKVVLLGYSMGGAITCEIALRKKLPLTGMVLLSSGADLKNTTPLVDDLKNVPMEQFKAADVFPALFGVDTPEDEKKKIIELFESTQAADAVGYGDLMASNRYNQLSECEKIDTPALMVHGADDKIVLPMAAIGTWMAIPDSELLMVPYKGHAVMLEDKELVREKILSFIEKL